MEITNCQAPLNFNYSIKWNQTLNKIQAEFDFFTDIEQTTIIARMSNPEYFQSSSQKFLNNSKSEILFPGYKKLTPDQQKTFTDAGKVTAVVTSAGSIFGTSVIVISSCWSQSFAFLSKLLQIIEFTSLMEYYNFPYDENLATFLSLINKFTAVELTKLPKTKYTYHLGNSRAGQWKAKLSQLDFSPYFLLEVGYPGAILMVKFNQKLFKIFFKNLTLF